MILSLQIETFYGFVKSTSSSKQRHIFSANFPTDSFILEFLSESLIGKHMDWGGQLPAYSISWLSLIDLSPDIHV